MRKILLLIAFCVCVSCSESFDVEGGESNMLDPAKGIDSQGETTLFSGKVYDTATGSAIEGAVVKCTENTSYSPRTIWTTTTDSDGYYYEREDVSSMYYDPKITVTATSYTTQYFVHNIDFYTTRNPVLTHDFPMTK